jgi:nucleolar protein 9
MKEKLAQELANNETRLRESMFGRNVWKNWAMDLFQRRPNEWRATAKDGQEPRPEQHNRNIAEVKSVDETPQQKKSAIQLARDRHVQQNKQAAKKQHTRTPATSANTVVPLNA